MILKLSIFGLVLVLIAVIAIQYYRGKERFENVDQPATIEDMELLFNALKEALPKLQARTPDAATTKRIKDIEEGLSIIPDLIISVKGGAVPPSAISMFYKSAIQYNARIIADPTIPLVEVDKPHSNHKMPAALNLTGACAGVSDNAPIEQVPVACMQQLWLDAGCSTKGIAYPISLNSDFYKELKGQTFAKAAKIMMGLKIANTNKIPEADDPNYKGACFGPSAPDHSAPHHPDRSAAAPQFNEVKPQIAVSDTGYAAMQGKQKSDLLESIQKIVRNELLSNRATQPTVPNKKKKHDDDDDDDDDHSDQPDSHCTSQGSEFKKVTPKRMSKGCPDSSDPCDGSDQPKDSAPKPYRSHMPDMSKYIKKDSIPCWGCSLDY